MNYQQSINEWLEKRNDPCDGPNRKWMWAIEVATGNVKKVSCPITWSLEYAKEYMDRYGYIGTSFKPI